MNLATPVSRLYMVGPLYSRRLEKLGITTCADLLYHFPSRYQDYRLQSKIAHVQPGETATVSGKIISMKNEYTKGGKKIQKAMISDETGVFEVIWFNQPFLVRNFKIGLTFSFSGKVDFFGTKKVMVSPEYEQVKDSDSLFRTIHTGRLVPIYPETYGVSSKWLRSRIAPLIEMLIPDTIDFLPEKITRTYNLLNLNDSCINIHFPETPEQTEEAKKRFAFEELFLIQLAALKRKKKWQEKISSFSFQSNENQIRQFINRLPFELTGAQKKVLQKISDDLTQNKPMNRLLQGDVGSGKTVVAAGAIYLTFLNGCQSVLMAPTEILAIQHYETLLEILSPLGVRVNLATGSIKNYQNSQGNIETDVLVGTHAVLSEKINFSKLGLVVIDEQHRFGVAQRAKLGLRSQAPHVLTMTATPIPRTVALTLFGDLDLSVIDEMPKGRKVVKTWVVPDKKRDKAYKWIRRHVKDTDEQAFIICPFIEESESVKTVKAATVEFEKLSRDIFPDLKLGLLHGKQKVKEKNKVIESFRKGELDILVSTPVVEVGIDIPSATIMMIEGAERYGLAQLHQLRGRVGRGEKESYCLLFPQITSGRPLERLKALERCHVGMTLAEIDLSLRGPGEIYGTTQHGFPDLKAASFTDLKLIEETRQAALEILPAIEKYPLLLERLQSLNYLSKPN